MLSFKQCTEVQTEATCNFYRAYVLNVKFGEDFDYAFANSMSHLPYLTPPGQAAIHWMVTENFRDGKDMDHSNTEHDEFGSPTKTVLNVATWSPNKLQSSYP